MNILALRFTWYKKDYNELYDYFDIEKPNENWLNYIVKTDINLFKENI